jgi:hypothetical protein
MPSAARALALQAIVSAQNRRLAKGTSAEQMRHVTPPLTSL